MMVLERKKQKIWKIQNFSVFLFFAGIPKETLYRWDEKVSVVQISKLACFIPKTSEKWMQKKRPIRYEGKKKNLIHAHTKKPKPIQFYCGKEIH